MTTAPTPVPVSPVTASAAIGPSVVRTVTALIVGALATRALRVGIKVDTAMVEPIITAAYYALVRVLETRVHPSWGWLLGLAKQPHYLDKPSPFAGPITAPK